MVSILLMALSLSVDAAAAAVCCGLCTPQFGWRDALRLGLWFGGFQMGMTLAGGMITSGLNLRVQRVGSVAAFGLLLYVGGRMLLDAASPLEEVRGYSLDTKTVAELALATSLDALAAGVSTPFLGVPLCPAAAVIGITAFLLTVLGGLTGRRVGQRFHRWASAAGGLVLTGIGVRILLEAML